MTAPPAITLRFDSGPLLLDGFVEGASEGATLPGCVWDPRVRRYRAPAWRYRELVTALTRLSRAGSLSFSEAQRMRIGKATRHPRWHGSPFSYQNR